MKKLVIISVLMVALSLGASGQFYYGGLNGYYSFPRTQYVTDSLGNIRFKPGDMGFSMEAGAFASSNFHGNSWFGTSISPAFAYNVSSRFRLKAGVTVFQGFGNAPSYDYYGFYNPYSSNATTTGIFVEGDYLLSNKLTLSGAVYKYFSPYNAKSNDPNYKGPNGESYMLNLNYRPAKNFEINASFEYRNGTGFYNQDPYYHPGLMPPLH